MVERIGRGKKGEEFQTSVIEALNKIHWANIKKSTA